jgi:hypothetical protein
MANFVIEKHLPSWKSCDLQKQVLQASGGRHCIRSEHVKWGGVQAGRGRGRGQLTTGGPSMVGAHPPQVQSLPVEQSTG